MLAATVHHSKKRPREPTLLNFIRATPRTDSERIRRSLWRRRRDSNPRYAFGAYNGLANRRLQPLGHVSVTQDQRVSMRVGKNKSEIATGLPPHHRAFVSTPSRHANVCPTPGPRKTSWSAYRSVHIQRRAFYRELYAVASLWASELLKGCTKRPTDHTIFTEPDCYEPLPSQSECPLSGVKRTCLFAMQMSAFDPKRTWPLR